MQAVRFDPTIGTRIAPAWKAALTVLNDREWHHRRDVIAAMLASSDLAIGTCSNVLRHAVRDELLEQSGEWHGRGDDRRFIRLVEVAAPVPEEVSR